MTCAEAREQAAAYALGALEPDERAQLERHLASPGPHDGCREAVARACSTAAALAGALPEARPDPAVWRAVELRTGTARAPRRRLVGPVGWAALAAAALALVLTAVERVELRRERQRLDQASASAAAAAAERDQLRSQLMALAGGSALEREALALLDRPGTRVIALAPQPGQAGRAAAILNLDERRGFIVSAALPEPPGKTYQLWVLRGTSPPRPAGFLRAAPGGTSAGELDPALLAGGAPDAVAVSLEPAGGSPAPTQVVMVGKV